MARKLSSDVAKVLMVLIVLGLAFVGALAGFIVGRASAEPETTAAITAPTGHSGTGLPAHEFGDPVRGATLFESMGCSMCHSFAGKGGTDAPPLDYMRSHLSAREVANMSGQIWNHLPAMLPLFEEEGIPFPTFTGDQMADLGVPPQRAGQSRRRIIEASGRRDDQAACERSFELEGVPVRNRGEMPT